MSKKLAAKNALINLLSPPKSSPENEADDRPPLVPRTRTAVGGMAQFVTTQSPIHLEAEALRDQVRQFAGAKLVRALDPACIIASDWANRHADNFDLGDFAQLKREIREARGNVQPIKVRPAKKGPRATLHSRQSEPDDTNTTVQGNGEIVAEQVYEIVYGHRRHRACLELGIPVNALIEEVDDQTLFEQMERENRGRKNLSAWEQGCMYLAALDKGLYASQRKLSEAIGVDVSLISKSVALARLPVAVIQAFASPLEIQFRWAQPLGEALARNPEGMMRVAKQLRAQLDKPLTSMDVFQRLIAHPAVHAAPTAPLKPIIVTIEGQAVGEFRVEQNGSAVLRLAPDVLPPERHATFLLVVQEFLSL